VGVFGGALHTKTLIVGGTGCLSQVSPNNKIIGDTHPTMLPP
jgi:hypothetical protein